MLHICLETHNFLEVLNNKKIKNIIFDLGGVIIDLDTSKTIDAFAEISGKSTQEVWQLATHDVFKQYEVGAIDDDTFRTELKSLLHSDVSDKYLDKAWNAMIGEIRPSRLMNLKSIKSNYNTLILSNTNHIHINYVHDYLLKSHRMADFTTHVHKVYYSQMIGLRKPNKDIFEFTLEENNLKPEETLFLDDNVDNLKGASEVGIKVIKVEHPDDVPELLANAGVEY